MQLLPGFGSGPKALQAAAPTTESPEIKKAREAMRMKELSRASRQKNIVAGELGTNPAISRPRAGAQLLGG